MRKAFSSFPARSSSSAFRETSLSWESKSSAAFFILFSSADDEEEFWTCFSTRRALISVSLSSAMPSRISAFVFRSMAAARRTFSTSFLTGYRVSPGRLVWEAKTVPVLPRSNEARVAAEAMRLKLKPGTLTASRASNAV